jgi:endonuclease YncB( thermonuclease family)
VVLAMLAVSASNIPPVHVEVVDGDTLRLGRERVRLYGIDAPEAAQTCFDGNGRFWGCGRAATEHLKAMVAGKPVVCVQRDRDVYHRPVSICAVHGTDLGEAMVRAGLAITEERYSGGRYRAAEMEARAGRRGMWGSTFETPKAWRARHKGVRQ